MKFQEWLIKLICEVYKGDPSSPSLIISFVRETFYTSIVRYKAQYGKDKEVVTKYHSEYPSENLEHCLRALSSKWIHYLNECATAGTLDKDTLQYLRDYPSD